jgi:hypothetical protein
MDLNVTDGHPASLKKFREVVIGISIQMISVAIRVDFAVIGNRFVASPTAGRPSIFESALESSTFM